MDERNPNDRPTGGRRRSRKPTGAAHAAQGRKPNGRRPMPGQQRKRIHWQRHALEFIVIVAGIMVSFLLNEWRHERQEAREERQLLIDLHDDLRQDSLLMANELGQLEVILQRGERLMDHHTRRIPGDSVVMLLSPSISYVSVPFQQVAYHAMRTTRSAALIEDRALLREILDLHESRYFLLREMFGIDRFLVLERMFPVTERHVMITETTPEQLDDLMADPEWRNLAAHSLLFKQQIAGMLRAEIAHGDGLMRRIEAQLEP